VRKGLLALILVALPVLANNYIALTLKPGTGGVVITYTYTVALTVGPFSFTTQGVKEAPNVPFTTTIDIDHTPTLIGNLEVVGSINVTASDDLGNVATGSQNFTLLLEPNKTASAVINITLSNGGELDAEIVMYAAKLSIPFAGIAALGAAALLGARKRRQRNS